MARQDIEIDSEYGELETTDNIVGKEQFEFTLLAKDSNFCYGEFLIPQDRILRVKSGLHKLLTLGSQQVNLHCTRLLAIFEVHSLIPYKPIALPLRVRFRVDAEQEEFILNPMNNSQWYDVVLSDGTAIMLSEYRAVNEANYFNLILERDKLYLYSGNESDLIITPSLSQNQACLLKTSAGGSYQHPLTGVGLIEFLHGNFQNTGLAQKLQKEFEADNMIIVNAYMDSESGELLLEVKEKHG